MFYPPPGYLRIIPSEAARGWKNQDVWVLEHSGVYMHFRFQSKAGEVIGQYIPVCGSHHWLVMMGFHGAQGWIGRV